MLAGDYLCYDFLARDRGADPQCRLCQSLSGSFNPAPTEDMVHLLTRCRGTADTRSRILPDLLNIVAKITPRNGILQGQSHQLLTQFIVDPTSLNLPRDIQIQPTQSNLSDLLASCSNFCFSVHKDRVRQLKNLGHLPNWQEIKSLNLWLYISMTLIFIIFIISVS